MASNKLRVCALPRQHWGFPKTGGRGEKCLRFSFSYREQLRVREMIPVPLIVGLCFGGAFVIGYIFGRFEQI